MNDEFINQLLQLLRSQPGMSSYADRIEALAQQGDYRGLQGFLSTIPGLKYGPDIEKYLDNMIGYQTEQENRDYQTESRDTNLLSTGNQLEQLGLSPSGVLQTGSISSGVTSQAADYSKTNLKMQQYAQRMGIAKQLLSMTSSMASAGVYGSAFLAAKKASAILSSQAAHSARMVTSYDANDNRTGRTISENLPGDFDYNSLF